MSVAMDVMTFKAKVITFRLHLLYGASVVGYLTRCFKRKVKAAFLTVIQRLVPTFLAEREVVIGVSAIFPTF